MELKGTVQDIIYKNETNGYTIATFDMESADTTIVGYLPFVQKGDSLKIIGKFVTHPDYGDQFKVETFEKIMPETLDALEKYLSNGIVKGVGPATAKKIIKKFGEETVEVLKADPNRLTEIKGITKKKAEEINESFVANWELWQIVGFLEKFGIGPQSANTIYKKLGANTISIVENDPYVLSELGVKVDFSQIDKMALDLGVERNNLKRVNAGIRHGLNLATYNGHSCVLEANLITFVTNLLRVSEDDVLDGIKDLRVKEQIKIEEREEIATTNGKTELCIQTWIYLIDYYKTELNIAQRILGLEQADNIKRISNFNKELEKTEKATSLELSEKQVEAVKMVNDNNVCIITGGPGTGKTTIIKTIIDIYKSRGKKVVLCAPTGRAAKRMTEATGEEASTLHRLLEIGKVSDEKPDPDLDVTPIDADVVIIDEMSMVDIFLMNYVVKALFKGTKLVLVGDTDQLPSVGPGVVLKDLIDSKRIPYIRLNKIFRQALQSEIIVNSHKVNEGINFLEDVKNNAVDMKISMNDDDFTQSKKSKEQDKDKSSNRSDTMNDFFFIQEKSTMQIINKILELYNLEEQIITPSKKGDLGTKNLNKVIQEKFNPASVIKNEKKFGEIIYREGDKIMQTKNNYDIMWRRKSEINSGIFNGEMGVIEKIDDEAGEVKIRFDDDKVAFYSYQDLDQIEHSFAITVHKSQGSEFQTVIIPIYQAAPMLLTRNLLYTGMTRAKDKLIMIGNPFTIQFMINNEKIKQRNSGLKYKLENL